MIGMTGHEGDLEYLAYCSYAYYTTMPTKCGASVTDAASSVHGQTNPIGTNGITRLNSKMTIEEMRCHIKGLDFPSLFPAEMSLAASLHKESIRRRKPPTPQ
ncbi:hypothetical protein Droror1_Dr00024567 [Drosera rotundifolia]